MKQKLLIFAIFSIAIFLRVVNIGNNPPALYGDELTIVYDAYSLLKTGHDQLGNFLPLTFRMGAGRPAGYVYGSVPFVALFGPTALGVRGLSILSGIGITLLLYHIGKKLFSEKLGIAAAAIAAVSPWEISLSRGGFEAHFALFLVLLGLYFFVKAKEKPLFYLCSALGFGLTLHTYPTYKVTLLLFLPLLIWFQSLKTFILSGKKYFIFGIIILSFLGFLSISQTFIGGSETRFFNINIFSQTDLRIGIGQKIDFERQITNLPLSLSKYFHNKQIEYGKIILENYLQNFSTDFLFIHGDRNPRQNMATIGQFYLADMILILAGLLSFWSRYKRTILFLLLWIILAPLPTAIIGLPHGLRSSLMLPPFILLSALGLVSILNLKNRLLISSVAVIFAVELIFFLQKYYFLAPNEYANFWSYPAYLAAKSGMDYRNNFKYVILSDKIDNIEFAYPVYAQIDPDLVIYQNKNKVKLGDYQLKKFNNVYIGYIPDARIENFIKSLDGSVLFLGSDNQIKFLSNFETIMGKDRSISLILSKKR